jgi:hypothetical protein
VRGESLIVLEIKTNKQTRRLQVSDCERGEWAPRGVGMLVVDPCKEGHDGCERSYAEQ